MKSLVVRSVLASLATLFAVASFSALSAVGKEPQRKDVQPFMLKKLKHAQTLVEGLANEDFDLIRDNAHALRKLVEDSQWKLSPNLTYIKYSAEFASIADELERRAIEKNP